MMSPPNDAGSDMIASWRIVDCVSEPARPFVVFRAVERSGRTTAIKVPSQAAVSQDALLRRLQTEAACLSVLRGLPPVVRRVAWVQAYPALVTEFVDGESLSARI